MKESEKRPIFIDYAAAEHLARQRNNLSSETCVYSDTPKDVGKLHYGRIAIQIMKYIYH